MGVSKLVMDIILELEASNVASSGFFAMISLFSMTFEVTTQTSKASSAVIPNKKVTLY